MKTDSFDPLYNFSEHQLEVFYEYINENLAKKLICTLKSLTEAPMFTLKPVKPLPVLELPVKSDDTYQATLWLRSPGPSRRLHN